MQTKTLRILQLGPYPPPHGGVQANMMAIKEELLHRGHECVIISITRSEQIGNVPQVYHPRNPFGLLKLLLTLQYDILHLHIGGEIPLRVLSMILLCTIIAPRTSVMTFHSGGYAVNAINNAHYWTLHGFVFRKLAKIIVVNNLMISLFSKFGVCPEKVQLIYPFVLEKPKDTVSIPQHFELFFSNHKKILLTVGLLEPHYDLPMQIEVLGEILKKFPKTGLVIVGSGSLKDDLKALIESKPYSKHVLLAGDTDHDVVLHLIQRCDILLRTTIFDGDAISIREAQYLGTPVIATDTGMRPEDVLLIPKGDHHALATKIQLALTTGKKKAPSGEDGRTNVRSIVMLYEQIHLRTSTASDHF